MRKIDSIWGNNDCKWGIIILSLYLVWALSWNFYVFFIAGNIFVPYVPEADMRLELLAPLESGFLLGTDIHGRSIGEVISMGLSYSIVISLIISLLSATIGTAVGYLIVIGPSWLRKFFEMFTNVIFIFPSILIAIIIMSFLGGSFWGLVFSLLITHWAGYARISRGEIKRIMGLPYIEAGQALGMGKLQLFFSSIFPGILPQLLIHIVLGISGVILSESTLGFLGLGGGRYSWGNLLSMGKTVLLEAPHIAVFVSLSMAGLIIGLNLLGDGLRDVLDPYSKR